MHVRSVVVSHNSTKLTLAFHMFGETAADPSDIDVDYGEFSLEVSKNATAAECYAAIQAHHAEVYPQLRADWVLKNQIAQLL